MYHPAATLVLIGGRGTGKSTLAVIAAIALRRRFVDTVSVIEAAVGSPVQEFVNNHGIEAFCALEYALLEIIFSQYPTECVVATSSRAIVGPFRALLQANTSKFPIVHISRSPTEISENFKNHPNRDAIVHRAITDIPVFRQCSNFEFTNLGSLYVKSHPGLNAGPNSNEAKALDSSAENDLKNHTSLCLRGLEKNFLHFIKFIYGDASSLERDPEFMSTSFGSAGSSLLGASITGAPMSGSFRPWQCAEDKVNPYTHALFLPFYDLTTSDIDFDLHAVGVDALILRIDLFASYAIRCGKDPLFYISTQVTFVRSLTSLPIIYDFDKSFFNLSLSLNSPAYAAISFYADVLDMGIRLNAEYITIHHGLLPDNFLRELVLRKNFSKLVFVQYLSSWDLETVRDIYTDSISKGFDLVQLISQAYSLKANTKLQNVLSQISPISLKNQYNLKDQHAGNTHVPLIAYNKGSLGRLSQCLNKVLTPVDCEAFFSNPNSFYYTSEEDHDTKRTKLGQGFNAQTHIGDDLWIVGFKGKGPGDVLTLQDRNAAIYSLGLQPRLKFYHFGSEVVSRISHLVNQAAFDAIYLPHQYTKVVANKLVEIQPLLERKDFGGAAISSPFKVTISQVCDSLSPHPRVVGAVNSLRTIRDPWTLMPRAIHGENVDWVSVRANIVKHLRLHNAITPNTKAVIIGAGGFAHAAVYSLARLGVKQFYVWNPNRKHAESMVNHFQMLFGATSNSEHSYTHSHVPNYNGAIWNALDSLDSLKGVDSGIHEWKNDVFDTGWGLDFKSKSVNSSSSLSALNSEESKNINSNSKVKEGQNDKQVNNSASDSRTNSDASATNTISHKSKSPQRAKKLLLKNILNSDDEDDEPSSTDNDFNASPEGRVTPNLSPPVSSDTHSQQQEIHSREVQDARTKELRTQLQQQQQQANSNHEALNLPLRTLLSNPSSPASHNIWITVLQGSLPDNELHSIQENTPAEQADETEGSSAESTHNSPPAPSSANKRYSVSPNSKITRNYGSISFQQSAKDIKQINFTILDSIYNPWPEDKLPETSQKSKECSPSESDFTKYPNIILNMSPDTELRLHPTFFANPTGGICFEANYLPAPQTSFVKQGTAVSQLGWNSSEAISLSSDPLYSQSRVSSSATEESEKPDKAERDGSDKTKLPASWEMVLGLEFMLEQAYAHFEYITEKRAPRKVMAQTAKEYMHKFEAENVGKNFKATLHVDDDVIEGGLKGKGTKRPFEDDK